MSKILRVLSIDFTKSNPLSVWQLFVANLFRIPIHMEYGYVLTVEYDRPGSLIYGNVIRVATGQTFYIVESKGKILKLQSVNTTPIKFTRNYFEHQLFETRLNTTGKEE